MPSLSALAAGDQQPLGASAPEIVEHDVDAAGKALLERGIERIVRFDELNGFVSAECLQRLQRAGACGQWR